jgi:hypothetical protein
MPGDSASGGGERGQASVEWLGLLLVAALALGALGLLAARGGGAGGGRELGQLAVRRLACAARASCPGGPRLPAAQALPGTGASPAAPASPGRAPPASPAPPAPRRAPVSGRPAGRARAVDALRHLRSVGAKLARRAWIVCIGYRRFRLELEHPRPPTEPMPLDEALEIANACLNPYAFFVEDE